MKRGAMLTAGLYGVLAAVSGQAAELKNVADFDASLVVGKICQGPFEKSRKGAVAVEFFVKDDALAARTWRNRKADAFANPYPATLDGYEDLGSVRELIAHGHGTMAGRAFDIYLVNAVGAKWWLTLKDDGFDLAIDPTAEFPKAPLASGRLKCRSKAAEIK